MNDKLTIIAASKHQEYEKIFYKLKEFEKFSKDTLFFTNGEKLVEFLHWGFLLERLQQNSLAMLIDESLEDMSRGQLCEHIRGNRFLKDMTILEVSLSQVVGQAV
jgi:hypothetical protein